MKNLLLFLAIGIGGFLFQGCTDDRNSIDGDRPQTSPEEAPLGRRVEGTDLIVYGKVLDMNPLNKDDINRYAGATIEPIEYWKGSSSDPILRISLMGFGRGSMVFPMMDDQVSAIEEGMEAIFFLSRDGGFRDLDTGIQTMHWELILPLKWAEAVKAEMDGTTNRRMQ